MEPLAFPMGVKHFHTPGKLGSNFPSAHGSCNPAQEWCEAGKGPGMEIPSIIKEFLLIPGYYLLISTLTAKLLLWSNKPSQSSNNKYQQIHWIIVSLAS